LKWGFFFGGFFETHKPKLEKKEKKKKKKEQFLASRAMNESGV
jgi:hypothetical protein